MSTSSGIFFLSALAFHLTLAGCVSKKVYLVEATKRLECETREKTIMDELLERRRESAEWAKRLADLSRELGRKEMEIQELEKELSERTAALGQSAAQLLADKNALERALSDVKEQLARQTARLASVSEAQKSRRNALEQLHQNLTQRYADTKGATVEIAEPAVLLTLADAHLFDKSGVLVSAEGRTLLRPLAELLSQTPSIGVEIIAYTDNAVPKNLKNVEDTWDWSLARANNIVRTLIQQFNVNANQLTSIGKGEYYPVASNETPEGRQRNRRTVIALYPPLSKVPFAGD
ncbi:MAG: OmpA family protein [Saprospiraceae bacterium]|nr:OmpA family protein [Saprospiraceae bacterium]MDW8483634.1 OmpA family protein [Saprospiraceae bacterium]